MEQLAERAGAQDHLLPEALEERLRQHVRTLVRVMNWPEFRRIERLVASAGMSLPDLPGLWHDISIRRFLEFLSADMAGVAQLPPGSTYGWDHIANVFVHTIAGWYHTEVAMRTPGDDEVARFSDGVIAAIMAAVRRELLPRFKPIRIDQTHVQVPRPVARCPCSDSNADCRCCQTSHGLPDARPPLFGKFAADRSVAQPGGARDWSTAK